MSDIIGPPTAAPREVINSPGSATIQEFDQIAARYRACRAVQDADPFNDAAHGSPEFLTLMEASRLITDNTSRAYRSLLDYPAPEPSALAVKLEAALAEYCGFEIPEDDILLIAADARRLGGRA